MATRKNTAATTNTAAQPAQPVVPQIATQPMPVPAAQPAPQENWFKRNWKKLALGAGILLTTFGGGFIAGRSGRDNDTNSQIVWTPIPETPTDDTTATVE